MNELLIQVDEQDTVIGAVDRLKAHLGDGNSPQRPDGDRKEPGKQDSTNATFH